MKTSNIQIREDELEAAVNVSNRVVEFDELFDTSHFTQRYEGKQHLILVAYIGDQPAGFMVSYDKYGDGSFYCWLAGVDPAFRRCGLLSSMVQYLQSWSAEHGYKKLRIKTRNSRREMLAFLVANDFNAIKLETKADTRENQILFERDIPLA